jgi:hypothetical protein
MYAKKGMYNYRSESARLINDSRKSVHTESGNPSTRRANSSMWSRPPNGLSVLSQIMRMNWYLQLKQNARGHSSQMSSIRMCAKPLTKSEKLVTEA